MAAPTARSYRPGRPGRPRRPPAARRTGYAIAALVNAALLYGVNVWPGWQAVPFLTDELAQVLGLLNLSLVVGIGVNLVYLVRDPPRLRALGDLLTTGVGLLVTLRLWQVFPVDLGPGWELLARVMLGLGIVGSGFGIGAAVVTLIRGAGEGTGRRT
jgi:hypothetical protein